MQPVLRVMIVEDEPIATRRLIKLVEAEEGFEIIAVAENGSQALETIERAKPDVLLLDVEMPGFDGFQLLRRLPSGVAPAVVFVTAFDSYAIKAFEARAVDYVMKPVEPERLSMALKQVQHDLAARDAQRKFEALQELVGNLTCKPADKDGYAGELWAQHRSEMIRIPVDEIDWIEAEKDYVRIHTQDRSYLIYGLIGSIGEKLSPALFMRVHRSAVVRLDRIQAISRGTFGALDLRLRCGRLLRVGRKYAPAVRSRLQSPTTV